MFINGTSSVKQVICKEISQEVIKYLKADNNYSNEAKVIESVFLDPASVDFLLRVERTIEFRGEDFYIDLIKAVKLIHIEPLSLITDNLQPEQKKQLFEMGIVQQLTKLLESEDKFGVRTKAIEIIKRIVGIEGLKVGEQNIYLKVLTDDGTLAKLINSLKYDDKDDIHSDISQTLALLFKAAPLPKEISFKVMEQLNSQLLFLISISHLAECPDNHDAILTNQFEKKLFEGDSNIIEYLQITYLILQLGSEENKQRVANAVKDKIQRLTDYITLQKLGKEQIWNKKTKKGIKDIVNELYQLIKKVIGEKENEEELENPDFGLSNTIQDGESTINMIGGTYPYLAPELFQALKNNGKRVQNSATDVWACGIIIYELLAHKLPFQNDHNFADHIIKDEIPELPESVSYPLRDLVKQMLEKDPNLRITTENIMENPEIKQNLEKLNKQLDLLEMDQDSLSESILPTQNYDNYTFIKKLSGGTMGRTSLVCYQPTGKKYVMKRVDYLDEKDKKIVDEEIELMKKFSSKYIVQLLCAFVERQEMYIVTEYCSHGDLRELMKELQKLPEDERIESVWKLFTQIVVALGFMHSNNVIHRDIKPENIFIMEDGSARLGDFGLSKILDEKEYYSKPGGTKFYMAPEVFKQGKMYFVTDIYALGIVIFECLTGNHPFQARNEQETINNIKNGKSSELPNWIPDDMKKIILRMIEKV
ncbi:MAG: putative NEK protein kinase [Streblomastix strix]|uniref:non-specific serine/threonine protein kinase n=1 Tax=Streblomastix strix TaxID=222440 RepID=A0A5J4WCI8_9EUKA|nr:MAG: putative NEK protein kinase [Streblomastix strix]